MLMDSNRIAAATCPECAAISKIKFNIFSFSGKKVMNIFCSEDDCDTHVWEIREVKDKYKVTINCPACDETHSYTMTKRNFWGKKYFSFNCPAWDVGILYIGNDEAYIDAQMDMQDDNISEMLGGFINMDDSFSVMYDLIECINEIAKTNNVKCNCDAPDVTMCIDGDKIILKCRNCNNTKEILPTEKNIDELMKTGTIVLDDTNYNKED